MHRYRAHAARIVRRAATSPANPDDHPGVAAELLATGNFAVSSAVGMVGISRVASRLGVAYLTKKKTGGRVSYRKPILVEMFAELHLEQGYLSQASFFDVVPMLKTQGLVDAEICQVVGVMITPEQVQQNTAPRVRCWSAKKDRLVQLSENVVIANLVGPYPGWKAFRALVDSVVAALTSSVGAPKPSSVSLTTIDKMKVPQAGFTLGRYLHCGGPIVPAWYADTSVASDVTLGKGLVVKDGFNRQVRIAVRPSGDAEVEIVATTLFHNRHDKGSVGDELEAIHEESNKTFESLITETTRQHMGGWVDATA